MELCEFVEKAMYGEDSFKSYNTGEKAGLPSAVWVGLYGGEALAKMVNIKHPEYNGVIPHSIPVDAMVPFENGEIFRKVMRLNIRTNKMELYVHYRMMRKTHRDYTWGKKKTDGTPAFKSKYYKAKMASQGVGNVSDAGVIVKRGGMVLSPKRYQCATCKQQVFVKRDGSGSAWCSNCNAKMFG